MGAVYNPATEAEQIAGEVIKQWHPHLDDWSVVYLEREGDMKYKGRQIGAKIRKATAVENALTGYDIVLITNQLVLAKLENRQKVALIDHEFLHIVIVEKESGERVVTTQPHDIEAFNLEIARHGAWHPGIEVTSQVVQEKLFPNSRAARARSALEAPVG